MKYIIFILISIIPLYSFGENSRLKNPCTQEEILFKNFLKNDSILLLKKIYLNEWSVFFIAYLDKNKEVCYEKRYDIIFKNKKTYRYSKKLLDNINESYIDIGKKNNKLVINVEYGNGQYNIENYYLVTSNTEIYLTGKDILYSRNGVSKNFNFTPMKKIEHTELYKFINNDNTK